MTASVVIFNVEFKWYNLFIFNFYYKPIALLMSLIFIWNSTLPTIFKYLFCFRNSFERQIAFQFTIPLFLIFKHHNYANKMANTHYY